jgi:hypothetical protein
MGPDALPLPRLLLLLVNEFFLSSSSLLCRHIYGSIVCFERFRVSIAIAISLLSAMSS